MNKNFSGKNAVYVSSPYSKEHSCKKSEKSLERFSTKTGHKPTTTQPTIPSLTSTNVENCNVGKRRAQRQNLEKP